MAFTPFNRELCRQFLSGAIRHPEVLALCPYITDQDFDPDANRLVFSALRACLASGGEFSEHVLIDRLKSLGIKVGGAIEPGIYVNSLLSLAVNDKAAVAIAKEIGKVTIRRKLIESVQEMQRAIEADATRQDPKKSVELVSEVTALFNKQVNLLSGSDDEPEDLYDVDGSLEEDTVYETRSVEPPFPLLTDLYGFFDPAELIVLCARMKAGKSTWLMSMLHQIVLADKGNQFMALVLDTEMTKAQVQFRLISAISGVKEYYIRRKLYKHDKQMRKKVEAAQETVRALMGRIHHRFVGGMSLDSQLNLVRRWYAKHIQYTGKRCLVALDYLKINSNSEFDSKAGRDIVVGKKTDAFKNLAKELSIPVWAMVQANREGEDSKGGEKMANTSVIANSDMIAMFGSNVYLLEKLSPDERALLQQLDHGGATHSLKALVTRVLGPDERGNDCLVKYEVAKKGFRYCQNYLLYSFERFVVKEIGSFKDLMERLKTQVNVQPPPDADRLL